MANITFKKLVEQQFAKFREEVKEIFSIAVIETYGNLDNQEEIIMDNDINASLYNPNCETLAIYADGERVGGAVINIDPQTAINWLDLFYIYPDKQGKGLGLRIWQNIEKQYHDTKVWRLVTPYFEKRNIHFYVNNCGFKIVEFFNRAHREPNRPSQGRDFHDEYFIFEKIMEQA